MLRGPLAIVALVLGSHAAHAADSCALHLLADLPVRYDVNTSRPVIDATINGQRVTLGLDLGSPVSALTATAVGRLGLRTHAANTLNGQIYIGNKQVDRVAAASIQLQQAYINERSLPVASLGAAWLSRTDGSIGLEMLRPFEIELDLPQHRFRIFSSDHCPNKVAYWPGEAEELPLHPDLFGRIIFAARLNNQSVYTMLTTHLTVSQLLRPIARSRLGLTVEPAKAGCEPSPAHGVTTLAIGAIEITNPRIDVDCQKPALVQATDIRPDLVLGLNHVKQLRIFIDFSDHKLFFIDPDAPPPPTR